MSEPKFVAETLAWCNERRAEQGKPPIETLPKGKRMDPLSCPCGLATGLSVGTWSYVLQDSEKHHDLSVPVHYFVSAFDRGQLPQYEDAA